MEELDIPALWWILQVPDGELDITKPLGVTPIIWREAELPNSVAPSDVYIGNTITIIESPVTLTAKIVYVNEQVVYVNEISKTIR